MKAGTLPHQWALRRLHGEKADAANRLALALHEDGKAKLLLHCIALALVVTGSGSATASQDGQDGKVDE